MPLPNATPVIRQYLSIKEGCPDSILFFRMGDFYEMFFEDAKTASRILEITLTSRNKKNKDAVPMCGVPVRAVHNYIGRLLENGLKVAICDQLEDSAASKGLVRRDVVRIITPGMIVENEYLDEKSNNYLMALSFVGNRYGFAFIDISTGVFRVTETDDANILSDEIRRVAPSEALLPDSFQEAPADTTAAMLKDLLPGKLITFLEERAFDPVRGRE